MFSFQRLEYFAGGFYALAYSKTLSALKSALWGYFKQFNRTNQTLGVYTIRETFDSLDGKGYRSTSLCSENVSPIIPDIVGGLSLRSSILIVRVALPVLGCPRGSVAY